VERVSLEADLRVALAANQFEVVYQPLFDMSDRRLSGVEALLRWNHPTRGLIMPMQFIPLAERTGEIIPIGRWVIEQACLTVGVWTSVPGAPQLRANVNVSARQLEPRLVDDVAEILRRTAFRPELLVLEITESVFASERPGVLEVLAALRSLGVRISIDDFGTGYSALSVLRDLPVDELKIDRSFIEALKDKGDTSLVEAIIKLSHDFELATVAEGIEVAEQATSLRALGCDVGQGYLLGRPVSAGAIEDLIRDGSVRAPGKLARSA
jgi:EAL domain-containing protein (putative c-di-GMP-specific phosphodiesterase class I)